MKNKLKVQFSHVGPNFSKAVTGFNRKEYLEFLEEKFDVEIVESDPDLLIYSGHGGGESQVKQIEGPTKLFISAENLFPDFGTCDYSIATVNSQVPGRGMWFPHALDYVTADYQNSEPLDAELANRKFCCFIYSHSGIGLGSLIRAEFAKKLMEYKFVDCPGKMLHNVDVPELSMAYTTDWHKTKADYIKQFKFIIAFENSDNPGYITEKLIDAYIANAVPIYWGSSTDISPFPKESMIFAPDYPTWDALVERVKEVDTNKELYMQILAANPFRNPDFRQTVRDFKERKKLFVQQIALNSLIQTPEFQDQRRKSMWKGAHEVDVETYSKLIPVHRFQERVETSALSLQCCDTATPSPSLVHSIEGLKTSLSISMNQLKKALYTIPGIGDNVCNSPANSLKSKVERIEALCMMKACRKEVSWLKIKRFFLIKSKSRKRCRARIKDLKKTIQYYKNIIASQT